MTDYPVHIRPVRDTDHAFILDSWCNTIRFLTPALSCVSGSVARIYRGMVNTLLNERSGLFRVLVRDSDDDQIFAWACSEFVDRHAVVHFVYVKREFRGDGFASMLVERPCVATHWTRLCEEIKGLTYKPSLFLEVLRECRETMGDRPAESCESAGESDTRHQDRRHKQAQGA